MRSRLFLVLAASAFLASGAAAQQVFVVRQSPGPGVFSTQIQPAIDAASDGDLILVKPGPYSQGFTIDGKAVSIFGDAGPPPMLGGGVTIRNLPAGSGVYISGILVNAPQTALVVELNEGPVWIEESDFTSGTGEPAVAAYPGARVDRTASLVLLRSTIRGGKGFSAATTALVGSGGIGLHATESFVSVYDGFAAGGTAGTPTNVDQPGKPGGDGAWLGTGVLFASGAGFHGGNGGPHSQPMGNPLVAGGAGGDGLQVDGTAFALACTFEGGNGGRGPGGGVVGPAGQPTAVGPSGTLSILPGTARHFSITSPIREQQTTTIRCGGVAGETVGAIVSFEQDLGLLFLLFSGVVLPELSSASGIALGVVPSFGLLEVPVPIPDLPASVQGSTLFLQPIFFDTPLTYARLGPGAGLVILDSSL